MVTGMGRSTSVRRRGPAPSGTQYPYYYYPYPYYYTPPPVVIQDPPVYVQQPGQAQTAPPAARPGRGVLVLLLECSVSTTRACRPARRHGSRSRPDSSSQAMKIKSLSLVVAAGLLTAACATVPTGPSVMVLPGSGKTFDQFQIDEATCRQWAAQQTGISPGQTATNSDGGGRGHRYAAGRRGGRGDRRGGRQSGDGRRSRRWRGAPGRHGGGREQRACVLRLGPAPVRRELHAVHVRQGPPDPGRAGLGSGILGAGSTPRRQHAAASAATTAVGRDTSAATPVVLVGRDAASTTDRRATTAAARSQPLTTAAWR